MKPFSLIPFALLVGLLAPARAFAQTPADSPTPAPTPAPAPTTPATTAETPPVADVPARQTPAAEPSTSPSSVAEVPRAAPPFDPRWSMTPAPIWWGKRNERPQVATKRWYGWQTIIAVTASDALMVASVLNLGANDGASAGFVLGLSGHVLSGPVVQWVHGNVGRGFGVFGLNLTLTAVGMLMSPLAPRAGSIPISAILGYLAGPALDIAFFSTEVEKVPIGTTAGAFPGFTWGFLPLVDSTRRGLVLTGQF